jgi:hypothetical protein
MGRRQEGEVVYLMTARHDVITEVLCMCYMCPLPRSSTSLWLWLYPPLQVNKIRELPTHPEVVVTHTDSPLLYVWNTATQPGLPRTTVRR